MKKICFFHLKAHAIFDSKSDAPIGGTLVQMHVIAKELTKKGYEVSFITGDFGQAECEVYDGIKVYKSAKLERKIGYYLIAPFKIWNCFRKVDADVYIASSAGAEIGFIALFSKILKKKMLYRTASETDCNGEYIFSHGLAGKLFGYGIKNANKIVTQSEEHRIMIENYYNKMALVIKNSYLISAFDHGVIKKYVLWVSRCESLKHPEIFLDLARKFPDTPFVMICPEQKYQEKLFGKIKMESCEIKNLEFIDFIPFEKIQKYFNEALIFVGTSDFEGFPNTFLQACMGMTPIVSYKVNPDNFIRRYDLGYYANGNNEELENALEKILADKDDWIKKSKNAFEYVKNQHDIEKNIVPWISLIEA